MLIVTALAVGVVYQTTFPELMQAYRESNGCASENPYDLASTPNGWKSSLVLPFSNNIEDDFDLTIWIPTVGMLKKAGQECCGGANCTDPLSDEIQMDKMKGWVVALLIQGGEWDGTYFADPYEGPDVNTTRWRQMFYFDGVKSNNAFTKANSLSDPPSAWEYPPGVFENGWEYDPEWNGSPSGSYWGMFFDSRFGAPRKHWGREGFTVFTSNPDNTFINPIYDILKNSKDYNDYNFTTYPIPDVQSKGPFYAAMNQRADLCQVGTIGMLMHYRLMYRTKEDYERHIEWLDMHQPGYAKIAFSSERRDQFRMYEEKDDGTFQVSWLDRFHTLKCPE